MAPPNTSVAIALHLLSLFICSILIGWSNVTHNSNLLLAVQSVFGMFFLFTAVRSLVLQLLRKAGNIRLKYDFTQPQIHGKFQIILAKLKDVFWFYGDSDFCVFFPFSLVLGFQLLKTSGGIDLCSRKLWTVVSSRFYTKSEPMVCS